MIGHTWAVDLLAGHISRKQERHAYLITGSQGVGRRTLALRFAQGLNCQNPPSPGQPCRSCSTCKRIEGMQHPDLAIVEAEHEGEVLRIDQVREMQHSLALAPYEARYRVALILRAEEAHSSAANAMLKTLEEPPPQVVVILTARSEESLLPTLVSRCEVVRLRPVNIDETVRGLQTVKNLPAEQSTFLAHISGGRPGYALRLAAESRLLEQRKGSIDELVQLLGASRRERFAFANAHTNSKEFTKDDLRNELQVWLTLWRDVLIYTSGSSDYITNLDYAGQLTDLARQVGMGAAHSYVRAIEDTIERIERNVNPRLALEVLLLDFPRLQAAE